MNVLIVESRFHPAIAEALTDGATRALQLGGAHFTRAQVPGILEIPAAIALGARADRFDGYVALGSMVRTGTAHFELITDNVFYGLTRLGTDHARMDREQRGTRHTILQTCPRCTPQRSTAVREPLIERRRMAPEGENLRTGEFQSDCHVRPCHSFAAVMNCLICAACSIVCPTAPIMIQACG